MSRDHKYFLAGILFGVSLFVWALLNIHTKILDFFFYPARLTKFIIDPIFVLVCNIFNGKYCNAYTAVDGPNKIINLLYLSLGWLYLIILYGLIFLLVGKIVHFVNKYKTK